MSLKQSERSHKMISHLGLVRMVIHRHFRYQIEAGVAEEEDLFSEGCIGLLKAVDRFDPNKFVDGGIPKFSTYAVPFIWGTIRHYLRDRCQPAGIKMNRNDTANKVYAQVCSLDVFNLDKLEALGQYERVEDDRLWVEELLERLPQRQKTVLAMNFFEGCTQKEVAQRLGVSESTAVRDKSLALEKLKKMVNVA